MSKKVRLFYVCEGKYLGNASDLKKPLPWKEALAYYRSCVAISKRDGVRPWYITLEEETDDGGSFVIYCHYVF